MREDSPFDDPIPPPRHRGVLAALQRVYAMSLGVQAFLIAAATVVIFGAVGVASLAYATNRLKDEMIRQARQETELLVKEAKDNIEKIMCERDEKSLANVSSLPEVRAQMTILSRNGAILTTAMVGSDGKILLSQNGQEPRERQVQPGQENKIRGIVPGDEGNTWELLVRSRHLEPLAEKTPIMLNNKEVGYLAYTFNEGAAVATLDQYGARIGRVLGLMVALVLAALCITVLLLYRAANGHIALQKKADETQHLASIGTLASGLAHEIRNPLHAMNLHLEAAREFFEDSRDPTSTQGAEIITGVQKQIGSLNAILTNFLKYAIPSRAELQRLPITQLVGQVTGFLAPEFHKGGIHVTTEIPEGLCILGDQTALHQVLMNVMLNATQFMDGRDVRHLTIRASQRRHGIALEIEDTGPGIPKGQEERIFDAFVSHRKGGTGFGLAIARRVMEQHGGTITATNRPEGGARFTLAFEAAAPGHERPASAAGLAAEATRS